MKTYSIKVGQRNVAGVRKRMRGDGRRGPVKNNQQAKEASWYYHQAPWRVRVATPKCTPRGRKARLGWREPFLESAVLCCAVLTVEEGEKRSSGFHPLG